MTNGLRRIGTTLAALPLLLAFASCSATSSPSYGSAGSAPMPADGKVTEVGAVPADGQISTPQIARTAALTLVVEDATKAAKDLRDAAATLGGTVLSEYVATANDAANEPAPDTYPRNSFSTIVISVPSSKLEVALDTLAALGKVTLRTVTANDVTTAVVDVDARVSTMRESIGRLQALMQRAGTLTEVATIEAELTKRQAELESLVGQQKALANQVDMAPVTVTLIPRSEAPVATGSGFLAGLAAGWSAFVTTSMVVITALGASVPFVVALVLLLAFAYGVRVLVKRRKRASKQS